MTTPRFTRIGITGADGHIGTTLREGLSDAYKITSFSLQPHDFPTTVADLSEVEAVHGIFEGLEAVIHLAANPSPRADWGSLVKNNFTATVNIFKEARRAGVKRIVFASSNHTQHGETMKDTPNVIDATRKIMMRLTDPPNPSSMYGVSKLFGEEVGRLYASQHGLEFVGLRIGATFRQDDPSLRADSPSGEYLRAMFLSKRDCVQAFTRALEVETNLLIAYAISNNGRRVFDLRETEEKLGFYPQDDAEDYF